MSRLIAIADVVALFFLLICFEVTLVLFGFDQLLVEQLPEFQLLGINTAIGLFTLVIVAGCLCLHQQRPSVIGLNRPTPLRFWIAAPVGLPLCYMACFVGAAIYTGIFGSDMEEMATEKLALFDLVSGLPMWIIPPFAIFVGIHEEVFFRGFLISRLRPIFRSDILTILISGILFGLIHGYQGWMGVFQTGAIGIVLAALAVYSRTLWPAIIAHASFDAVSLLIMPFLQGFLEDSLHEMSTSQYTMAILTGAMGTVF